MHEASFWRPEGDRIRCTLCPKGCLLGPGQTGGCRARQNREGRLESLNYGEVTSVALDPIEKKPLYHFYPGRDILSLGTFGCNFSCRFCQNYSISQERARSRTISPEQAVSLARQQPEGTIGLAYTYSEPSVWYEFVRDAARQAHSAGLKNVLVSNGYVSPEPLQELIPFIDAANIDVKAFSDAFYREVCGGSLKPVLQTVEALKKSVHVEITTLVVPGLNDSEDEIRELVAWVSGLGRETPLHLSRYFPTYQMTTPPTPVETLIRARDIARESLHYVYLGNAATNEGHDTACPGCGGVLVSRDNWEVRFELLDQGKCGQCGRPADIIEGA